MNRVHIPAFPNQIPCIDWKTNLTKFIDGNKDEAILHLLRFHWHIHKLGIKFHEDCLMKFFMDTLEGKSRSWYGGLNPGSLYSLKYFHRVFTDHCGMSLLQSFYDYCEGFIA